MSDSIKLRATDLGRHEFFDEDSDVGIVVCNARDEAVAVEWAAKFIEQLRQARHISVHRSEG